MADNAKIATDTINGGANGAGAGSVAGPWGAIIGGAVGAGSSLLGGIMGSNAEEEAYKRRKQAYDNMIKRATGLQTEGERVFNNIVNNPNPYLNQVAYDLKNNTNDVLNAGRNQVNAGLAQQGIRGGQAGTLLARSVGNMTNQANQDLNNMMYQDIANNRNLQAAYNQAKALAGINASLQEFQG
ncbi:MAG: hypothetical protein J6S85_06405 [Methanobrevibacter sp.]|nr:hypothetical protein [Methanobrevibacter sp.]